MKIKEYLKVLIDREGSDLHLKVGRPPLIRIKGDLLPTEFPILSKNDIQDMLLPLLSDMQRKTLFDERELDFSYLIEGLARFRFNIFYQLGNLGAVIRAIPISVPSPDELGLPEVLKELILNHSSGIILITGPTGSGKSTTLASLIEYLNERVKKHIITIEDPVEFVYSDKNCSITQRELGSDTKSLPEALKRALRQDPDIILVGEMRDQDTIHTAVTAAETGHLVLSTLHTNNARQSITRILDNFPPEQQNQVRMQLAMTLVATISQRLVNKSDGTGRVVVVEVMINTPTIKRLIIDNKLDQIDKVIADSAQLYKMQTMNQHLFKLVKEGILTKEDALNVSLNPNDLRIMLQTQVVADIKKEPPLPHWIREKK